MSRALRRTYRTDRDAIDCELRLVGDRLQGVIAGEAEPRDVCVRRLDPVTIRLEHEGRIVRAHVVRDGDTAWVAIDGHTYALQMEETGAGAAHHAGEEDFAVSPMTGTLAKVAVEPGQQVDEGAELFVVEAMKMEYVVRAPRAVTVAEVRGAMGEQVEQGRVVVAYEVEA